MMKCDFMPYNEVSDIAPGGIVEGTGRTLEIKVGEALIGKVIDPLGMPIDQSLTKGLTTWPIEHDPPNPLNRPSIHEN